MKKCFKILLSFLIVLMISGCNNKEYGKKDLEAIKNYLTDVDDYKRIKEDGTTKETIKGNELIIDVDYENNKYNYVYTLKDNHLHVEIEDNDYVGPTIYYSLLEATSKYLNVDSEDLINLVNSVSMDNIKSDYFKYTELENSYSLDLLLTDKYDFSILKELKITEEDYEYYEPLNKEYSSIVLNKGSMLIRINGSIDEAYFIYAEKGQFSKSTIDNIYTTISYFLPNEIEKFKNNYNKIKSTKFDNFEIKVNATEELKSFVSEDKINKYNVILITYTK